MAKKYVTNGDRILQAVLADEDLIRFGEYNPAEYNDLNIALYSNNLVVKTVAQIISGVNNGDNNKEIYTVVTKLLQKREMRKDIVIELSYKGFSRASDYS